MKNDWWLGVAYLLFADVQAVIAVYFFNKGWIYWSVILMVHCLKTILDYQRRSRDE